MDMTLELLNQLTLGYMDVDDTSIRLSRELVLRLVFHQTAANAQESTQLFIVGPFTPSYELYSTIFSIVTVGNCTISESGLFGSVAIPFDLTSLVNQAPSCLRF